jgi:hypothetical protein
MHDRMQTSFTIVQSTLDGTSSSDRDGKIIAWEWTKIASPASLGRHLPETEIWIGWMGIARE